jgi:hypothetical protein
VFGFKIGIPPLEDVTLVAIVCISGTLCLANGKAGLLKRRKQDTIISLSTQQKMR